MAEPKAHEPELTPREAIGKYERDVQQSGDAQAHFNLGSAHYVARELDPAMNEFQKALTMSPEMDHARYYIGVIHKARGELDKAKQEFEKIINGKANFMLKNQAKIQMQNLKIT